MANKHRVLVMSHGHPDFSVGGGEIAAHALYNAYRGADAVEEAWFLGRADRGRGATGAISLRRSSEYLWEQAVHDWHLMKALHQESVTTTFADFIRALRPSVVHTHHYAHLGLEYLRVIKQVDPSIQLLLTLHEYMAICRSNGQMIKTDGVKLCHRESYEDCRRCFPEQSAEDFWLRKHFFLGHFELVDRFVAPSEFLRCRYVEWGLPKEKVVVIENGQSSAPAEPPRPLRAGEKRNRFAFFGQVTPYKGLDVVLEALSQMSRKDRKRIVLEVHAANLELQAEAYRHKVEALREPLIREGVVQWVGPYQPNELRQRMAAIDWVLVPSIWWENSPMVIQEAFVCGRPLIVSNIGGMAEKVRDGKDGLHVPVGQRNAWADALLRATEPSLWDSCYGNLPRPLSHEACARAHLELLNGQPS